MLSRELAERYWVSRLECSGATVVDATGRELNRLGVDSMLFASTRYRLTRRWARAFMQHPDEPSGILYYSRKNPELTNCAFFEPPAPTEVKMGDSTAIVTFQSVFYEKTTDERLLEHPLFAEVLDRYEIALV